MVTICNLKVSSLIRFINKKYGHNFLYLLYDGFRPKNVCVSGNISLNFGSVGR